MIAATQVSGQEIAFVITAVVGLVAAAKMVTTRNVVHGALYLVITLASVGGIYLIMAAEFVGWVQILIYVGAIVVLVLFSLMLTKAPIGRDALDNQQKGAAGVVGLLVLAGLIYLIRGAFHGQQIHPTPTSTAAIGTSIFTHFVLPFEVISMLLLAALIGAVVIARKEEQE